MRDASVALGRGRSDELHAIRIDVKHLRYNLELLVPFAREDALASLDMLAVFQERLGALADNDSFAKTFGSLAAGVLSGDAREPGLAALRRVAERDRERALVAVRALWRGEEATYPERLAASISATLASVSANAAPKVG